jgi:hypothetical protein
VTLSSAIGGGGWGGHLSEFVGEGFEGVYGADVGRDSGESGELGSVETVAGKGAGY